MNDSMFEKLTALSTLDISRSITPKSRPWTSSVAQPVLIYYPTSKKHPGECRHHIDIVQFRLKYALFEPRNRLDGPFYY